MEKMRALPALKTPMAFPTFPQLRLRLAECKITMRKTGAGQIDTGLSFPNKCAGVAVGMVDAVQIRSMRPDPGKAQCRIALQRLLERCVHLCRHFRLVVG